MIGKTNKSFDQHDKKTTFNTLWLVGISLESLTKCIDNAKLEQATFSYTKV
jgi:hypothetical protein